MINNENCIISCFLSLKSLNVYLNSISFSVPVVDTLRTAAVFPVSPTEAPLAAAEVLALRVALSGAGSIREGKLRAAPPVFPPESHPVPASTSTGLPTPLPPWSHLIFWSSFL